MRDTLTDSHAMIYRFPRQLPSFAQLMEDPLLSGVPSAQLCKVFKVSPRTLRRWQAKNAPRAVRLALWSASLEGASNREVEAHNRAIQALGIERCLTEETKRLRQHVALLLRVGTFGSANEPLWGPSEGQAILGGALASRASDECLLR